MLKRSCSRRWHNMVMLGTRRLETTGVHCMPGAGVPSCYDPKLPNPVSGLIKTTHRDRFTIAFLPATGSPVSPKFRNVYRKTYSCVICTRRITFMYFLKHVTLQDFLGINDLLLIILFANHLSLKLWVYLCTSIAIFFALHKTSQSCLMPTTVKKGSLANSVFAYSLVTICIA